MQVEFGRSVGRGSGFGPPARDGSESGFSLCPSYTPLVRECSGELGAARARGSRLGVGLLVAILDAPFHSLLSPFFLCILQYYLPTSLRHPQSIDPIDKIKENI